MDKADATANTIELAKLRQWFKEQPPIVAGVFGSRIGLRMLPLAIQVTSDERLSARQNRHAISAFRYAALGWLGTVRPNLGLDAISTAVNTAAPRQTSAALAVLFEGHAAALSVVKAANGGFYAETPALRASHAASIASFDHPASVWEPVSFEKSWIEAGGEPSALVRMSVWPDQTSPNFMPERYHLQWKAMQRALEDEDEAWKVWTAWYQDRLNGSPIQSEEAEYFRLTTIENAMIKADDTSDAGRRLWMQETDGIVDSLRESPRRMNRAAAAYIASKNLS